MEYQEHYDNLEQRKHICKDYASRGLRCLYDNFDEDWQRGDEPHGTLTFTDEPAPSLALPPEPPRDYGAEIDDLRVRIRKLEKRR